ncbi:MAG: hypothetical protein ACQEWV_29255 [Bacillota bacterium]
MGMMMNEDVVFNRFINTEILEEKIDNIIDIEIFFTEIFALATISLQKRYPDYLLRVIPSKDTVYKTAYEINKKTVDELKSLLEAFTRLKKGTPKELGEIKYYFDSFFLSITKKGTLEYRYDENYLLTVEEAGEKLNVTRPTINKYAKLGQLEMLDTTKHKKIPIHAVEIWNDTDLNTKVQMLHHLYVERENPLLVRYEELLMKIKEFEKIYNNQPFEIVYKDVLSGEIHWDEVDSVSDYFEWEGLIEDLNEIKGKLDIN